MVIMAMMCEEKQAPPSPTRNEPLRPAGNRLSADIYRRSVALEDDNEEFENTPYSPLATTTNGQTEQKITATTTTTTTTNHHSSSQNPLILPPDTGLLPSPTAFAQASTLPPSITTRKQSTDISGAVPCPQRIRVITRLRPRLPDEKVDSFVSLVCKPETNVVLVPIHRNVPSSATLTSNNRTRGSPNDIATKTFAFDGICPPQTSQDELYRRYVAGLVDEVLLGFSCTVMAYGQTGSGKSYTMEGPSNLFTDGTTSSPPGPNECPDNAGVILRAASQIFTRLASMNADHSVKMSTCEVYNEELRDLLGNPENNSNLKVIDNKSEGAAHKSLAVEGLTEKSVCTLNDVWQLQKRTSQRRQTADTLLNPASSRSHCIVSLVVHIREPASVEGDDELVKVGKLHLVDLAGSENVQKSGASQNKGRKREASNINTSLLTLGRVINSLLDQTSYVPYRDSKLTRLLQEALGGRSKTLIIATVSESPLAIEETLSTLDYAHRARNIKNKPVVNLTVKANKHLKDLCKENERLKQELENQRDSTGKTVLDTPVYRELMMELDRIRIESKKNGEKRREVESKLSAMQEQLNAIIVERDFQLGRFKDLEDNKRQLESLNETLQTENKSLQLQLVNKDQNMLSLQSSVHSLHGSLVTRLDSAGSQQDSCAKLVQQVLDAHKASLERVLELSSKGRPKDGETLKSQLLSASNSKDKIISLIREGSSVSTGSFEDNFMNLAEDSVLKILTSCMETLFGDISNVLSQTPPGDREVIDLASLEACPPVMQQLVDKLKRVDDTYFQIFSELSADFLAHVNTERRKLHDDTMEALAVYDKFVKEKDATIQQQQEILSSLTCRLKSFEDLLSNTRVQVSETIGDVEKATADLGSGDAYRSFLKAQGQAVRTQANEMDARLGDKIENYCAQMSSGALKAVRVMWYQAKRGMAKGLQDVICQSEGQIAREVLQEGIRPLHKAHLDVLHEFHKGSQQYTKALDAVMQETEFQLGPALTEASILATDWSNDMLRAASTTSTFIEEAEGSESLIKVCSELNSGLEIVSMDISDVKNRLESSSFGPLPRRTVKTVTGEEFVDIAPPPLSRTPSFVSDTHQQGSNHYQHQQQYGGTASAQLHNNNNYFRTTNRSTMMMTRKTGVNNNNNSTTATSALSPAFGGPNGSNRTPKVVPAASGNASNVNSSSGSHHFSRLTAGVVSSVFRRKQ